MAVYTRATGRTQVRTLLMDSSTSSPGLSDTNINDLLDDAHQAWAAMFPDDPRYLSSTATAAIAQGNSGASVATSGGLIMRELLEISMDSYAPMKRDDLQNILRLQVDDPTQGRPLLWAPSRMTSNTAQSIVFHPISDAAYTLDAWFLLEPASPTGDSDTYLGGGDAGSKAIALMAAIAGAPLLGRSDSFIAALERRLPQKVKEHYGVIERATRPRSYPGKSVA